MKIAVVGCNGAVGVTMLELLANTGHEVKCMASSRSANTKLKVGVSEYLISEFSVANCADCDIVFLCVSGAFSLEFGPKLAKSSCVIDNSSAFRYHDDVPLLVPPINGKTYRGERLIANPNCSSAIALMVLGPLHARYGLESVIVSTYQAASGAGRPAMQELVEKARAFEDYNRDNSGINFAHNPAFNVIPQVDNFESNGYTREEMKVVWELRKVLNLPELAVSTTAVRVPTLRSHAEALTLRFQDPVADLHAVRELLRNSPGVDLVDQPEQNQYPMPMTSTYKHAVEVGRIRHNLIYGEYGLDMFISGDQLLRGAALNAYEIMQLVADLPESASAQLHDPEPPRSEPASRLARAAHG
ncbi:aspartate-semialdehyde dehydrogenase [Verminephrobacter aporrectodeae subsp. tuberculatae]|nr:aspartate-semialdehyde dehydrogenase [Verminephrobacter aporrectodeae subsp. tuberculatae]MCW8163592.1 aspartate-semialdehyde dehydrogenase [Verminephrobacter aporrectodeae subsp. tuberculatae]MCW8169030.1 aspartate-semialdehyde dehydrogenase [Verminephrobacter aporrectodeae subsp. tuberculatae]MCW8208574.1 aspartate-semialdehyde dehydrogenase [Verminephrobacter aporrectodeae subsp. tuberculatae]